MEKSPAELIIDESKRDRRGRRLTEAKRREVLLCDYNSRAGGQAGR